jgi:hypothetical protein
MKQRLEEEIADVRASSLVVIEKLGLDENAIALRTAKKIEALYTFDTQP